MPKKYGISETEINATIERLQIFPDTASKMAKVQLRKLRDALTELERVLGVRDQ